LSIAFNKWRYRTTTREPGRNPGISDRYRDDIAARFLHGRKVGADGREIAQQLQFDVAGKTRRDVPKSMMHQIK
jgi:hypothetical protein